MERIINSKPMAHWFTINNDNLSDQSNKRYNDDLL